MTHNIILEQLHNGYVYLHFYWPSLSVCLGNAIGNEKCDLLAKTGPNGLTQICAKKIE